MKSLILVAVLIGAVCSQNLPSLSQKNEDLDYFKYWNCPGTTNPIVQQMRIEFTFPPQVDVHSHIELYLTPNKSFFATQLSLTVKYLGVQLYKFTEDVGKSFPKNVETLKGFWLPTEQAPGGMQVTGELGLYNEFGEKVICFNYWMLIRPANPNGSTSDALTY